MASVLSIARRVDHAELAEYYVETAPEGLLWAREKIYLESQLKRSRDVVAWVAAGNRTTLESIELAIQECAAMGLTMSPAQNLVYLIPRRLRERYDGESKTEYEKTVPVVVDAKPSYLGLKYIAVAYGDARDVAAEIVFVDDEFTYRGPFERVDHIPVVTADLRSQKHAVGVYAMALFRDGTARAEYLDEAQIAAVRECSRNKNGKMWTALWTEGWKKAAIRRLCKTLTATNLRMAAAYEALGRPPDAPAVSLSVVPRETAPEPVETDPELVMLEHDADPDDDLQALPGAAGDAIDSEDAEPVEPGSAESGPQSASQAPAISEVAYVAVESRHPDDSIEWWADQIDAAETLETLDSIRAAALTKRVDQGENVQTFRELYKARARIIRKRINEHGEQPAATADA